MNTLVVQSSRLGSALNMAAKAKTWRVYAISDNAGEVVYVGSSGRVRQRYRDHLASYNKGLRAWLALNSHSVEVLAEYQDKRHMLDAELEYIEYLRPCFNALP